MSWPQGFNLALASSSLVGLGATSHDGKRSDVSPVRLAARRRDGDHRAVRLKPEEDIHAENLQLDPGDVRPVGHRISRNDDGAAAQARPLYYQWWMQKYPDVTKKNNVKAAVKCNVCHVGTKKEDRNDYGKAIIKGLDGKKNVKKKDKQIFEDALKTAEGEKSGTPDKTFGDLLQAGELPVSK